MPIKETPWGSMNQNRAAMNVAEDGTKRPPKPGFLPPAPPPFSVSPLPTANGASDTREVTSTVHGQIKEPVVRPSISTETPNRLKCLTLPSSRSREETNIISLQPSGSDVIHDKSESECKISSNSVHDAGSGRIIIIHNGNAKTENSDDSQNDSKEDDDEESESSYEYYDTSSEEEDDENSYFDESDEHERELEKALDVNDDKQQVVSAREDSEYDDDDDEYDYVLKTPAEVICAKCPIAHVHVYTACAQCQSTL